MRLSTTTGLIAGAATMVALTVLAVGVSILFRSSANDRVDELLRERAEQAPIFAAVGERVSASELNATLDGVRVIDGDRTITIGRLPDAALPPLTASGERTVQADGESWRLYAVDVVDVPRVGDSAIVEFVEPLGQVEEQVQTLRQRTILVALLTGLVVGGLATLLGRRATRPLTDLAHDANRIEPGRPDDWSVRSESGSPEVDDVARALNRSLEALAAQTERTSEALTAARAFGAAASHELRTPLQSALTNLDLAATDGRHGPEIEAARREVQRAAERLSAVRSLSAIDLVTDDDFVDTDVAEIVDRCASSAERGFAAIEMSGPEEALARVWPDGVRLAVDNVIRNALVHARPDGPVRLAIHVASNGTITVDDDGLGIAAADRDRLLERNERGSAAAPGSGLGLALAVGVAEVHGGLLDLADSPLGGLRVTIRLTPT